AGEFSGPAVVSVKALGGVTRTVTRPSSGAAVSRGAPPGLRSRPSGPVPRPGGRRDRGQGAAVRENRIAFTARLLRPADLLDLRVTAAGTDLTRRAGAVVVGEDGGVLVVELAFQHLGEQAFPESLVDPDPSGIARHRAARPSRLVYDLPAGT